MGKIAVSACLLGQNCKYNGGNNKNEAVLKFLGTGFSYSPKNFSVLPLSAEHEICGKKIRLFCSNINGAVLTAAFCGEEEFEFTEFFPKDLIY